MKKFFSRKFLFFVLVFGVVLFLTVIFSFSYLDRPVDDEGKEIIFIVQRGEAAKLVAARLEEEGLIRNQYLFLFSLWRYQLQGKIQAGSYRLSPQMAGKELAFALTKGRLDQWVTIIEGVRREEIACQVENELVISEDDFLAASRGKEGYLFPDSYLVPLGSSGEKLVEMMTANFSRKTMAAIKEGEGRGLTEKEIITIASLVEREAKSEADRAVVAGIIVKRWQEGWPLQIDATVQYAVGSYSGDDCSWWKPVSSADLKIDSPYNTYKNVGLPPGPICNPSLSSIRATANYKKTRYWFYLSDREGKIHFAETLAEHQANINRHLN